MSDETIGRSIITFAVAIYRKPNNFRFCDVESFACKRYTRLSLRKPQSTAVPACVGAGVRLSHYMGRRGWEANVLYCYRFPPTARRDVYSAVCTPRRTRTCTHLRRFRYAQKQNTPEPAVGAERGCFAKKNAPEKKDVA